MSNGEARPVPQLCDAGDVNAPELIKPREVPLGGLRAMNVRRTLPSRQRSLIGAWCFIDHYGPDDVHATGGMSVAPHPHIGLQTVSWLFQGEIEHRDSAGHHALVLPGEVNLMTAGQGISHSEVSTKNVTLLHGVQLWVALPAVSRQVAPGFTHHVPPVLQEQGCEARVFLGTLLGHSSPVETYTPLLGAELLLQPGASFHCDVDESFEHGILVDEGTVSIHAEGHDPLIADKDDLAYLPIGSSTMTVTAERGARVLLLGGPPFGEQLVMWWNFLASTQAEIMAARTEWQRQITDDADEPLLDSQDVAPGQFGVVIGDHLPPIPAPHLPEGIRLRPRR